MFRTRQRAASNPASKTPPSASASLAATKAFIRDRDSNASLSSAAAAAALKTHATGPTRVGDTITKRMVRKGSVSSQGSGSQQPPGLRRHSSSGSMTERSFRAPSPSRNGPIDAAAPPVPVVPREVPGLDVVHRRASSLEPPFHGGSPVARSGGRGVSLDRGVAATAASPGRGQPRVVSLSKVPEDEQDGSPRSVNFSRPISPQQTMAPPTPVASARGGHSGWFGGPVVNTDQTFRGAKPRPKTLDGLSAFEVHSTQQAVQNAAYKPVSTKKTRMSHGVEGARLATGGMRARSIGSAMQSRQPQTAPSAHPERPRTVDSNSPYAIYDPSTRTFIHKQDAMALHRALSDAEDEPVPPYEAQHIHPRRHHEASQQSKTEHQPAQIRHAVKRPPSLAHIEPRVEPRGTKQQDEKASTAPVAVTQGKPTEARPPTPPTSYPSASASLARQTSEDFAGADIRPSIDTNMGRKLESSALEGSDETQEIAQSPKLSSNQDSPYPRLAPPAETVATRALEPQRQGSVRSERTHSLSPPRNAHFAAVAFELPNGVKHQPPPRSVSPSKSALKASPSVSRRGSLPIANDGRDLSRGASSVSDAASEDATKNQKKKKKARVSFDEDPVIAGTSAYAEVETPTYPPGLSASRWSSANGEEELDDFMKPRPVLPSFGSIRDKNRRSREGEVPEKVTETISSSLSTSTSASGVLESSSDHAIARILARDFATKQASQPSQEPLPPEVTSVEGSGYVSDSDQSDASGNEPIAHTPDEIDHTSELTQSTPEPEPKTLTTEVESRSPAPEVPVIAVQPASPSPVERTEPKFQRPFVPGGWGEDDDCDTGFEEKEAPRAAPEPVAVPGTSIKVPVSQIPDEESTDDNSSIYSDAYEDLSETEDGGFGSIDAVVESPVVSPPPGLKSSKYADLSAEVPPKSRLRREIVDDTQDNQEPETTAGWDAARQHWNNVNGSRKQQNQSEPLNEQPVAAASASDVKKQSPAQQVVSSAERKARAESATKASKSTPPSKPAQPSAQPPAQPRKSAMKKTTSAPLATASPEPQLSKTMRGSAAPGSVVSPEPRLRKSMRDAAGGAPVPSTEPQLQKTLRTADGPGANKASSGLAASRYSMLPLETKPPKGTLRKKHLPAAAATLAARPRPQSAGGPFGTKPIVPAPTYDSDSDASASSFQRQRPRASRNESGRYTMRASMRSGPTPTMRAMPTMRPMSPPQATSPPPALRKSMRPTSPTVEPPAGSELRSSKFSIRSLSPASRFRPKSSADAAPPLPTQTSPERISAKIPTFGKSSKSKATSTDKPRFKSRFADSSDEEEDDRPQRFQSRFADSDDDEDFELPPGLAPVRGIPKRPGDEDRDSTDLEDEASDAEPSPEVRSKDIERSNPPVTNGKSNAQGANFTAGSLRKSKHATELPAIEAGKKAKSKRGFFGLGKKKAPASCLDDALGDGRNGAYIDIPMPPEQRNRDRNRPLTPIGEDKDIEAGEANTRSPKLQRRSTPQWGRSTSDSWPLPQPPKIGEETGPQSSEARTAIDPKTGKEVVVGRTGKKKKFQGLRRVFGLND